MSIPKMPKSSNQILSNQFRLAQSIPKKPSIKEVFEKYWFYVDWAMARKKRMHKGIAKTKNRRSLWKKDIFSSNNSYENQISTNSRTIEKLNGWSFDQRSLPTSSKSYNTTPSRSLRTIVYEGPHSLVRHLQQSFCPITTKWRCYV